MRPAPTQRRPARSAATASTDAAGRRRLVRHASRLHDLQRGRRAQPGDRAVVHPLGKRRRHLEDAGVGRPHAIDERAGVSGRRRRTAPGDPRAGRRGSASSPTCRARRRAARRAAPCCRACAGSAPACSVGRWPAARAPARRRPAADRRPRSAARRSRVGGAQPQPDEELLADGRRASAACPSRRRTRG